MIRQTLVGVYISQQEPGDPLPIEDTLRGIKCGSLAQELVRTLRGAVVPKNRI